MVPSVIFRLRVLWAHSSATCRCVLRPPRSPWWLKPTSRLTFIGKVTLCLLSIRGFLLLNVVETGWVSLGEEIWENVDSFSEVPVCVH